MITKPYKTQQSSSIIPIFPLVCHPSTRLVPHDYASQEMDEKSQRARVVESNDLSLPRPFSSGLTKMAVAK